MSSELASTLLFGILSFSILLLSWKRGFFSSPIERASIPLRWFHPLSVFAIYAAIVYFVQIALVSLLIKIVTPIPPIAISCWLTFITSFLILLGLLLYCSLLPKEITTKIWSLSKPHDYTKDIYFGALSCLIAFPLLLFLGQFFDLFIYFIFHVKDLPDQVAVLFLKMTFGYPLYFFLTLITVVFFAPCIEETLFRGFFQSFLRQHLGPKISIIISSLCFAFFHYSPEQGVANISIIGSLFGLALFLGFIYEKRGSLLAPIILHSSFNTISVINLYFLEGISKT
jgi:hypothetical protein